MPFPLQALGVDINQASGLLVNRTVIAAQTTPTTVKTSSGTIHGVIALNTSTTSLAAIQYFTSASTTLGVSTPTFEVFIPAGASSSTIAMSAVNLVLPIGLPMSGGIYVAAGTAASTGPNVAASTVTVYTLYV